MVVGRTGGTPSRNPRLRESVGTSGNRVIPWIDGGRDVAAANAFYR
jgi:hypothetical protein